MESKSCYACKKFAFCFVRIRMWHILTQELISFFNIAEIEVLASLFHAIAKCCSIYEERR